MTRARAAIPWTVAGLAYLALATHVSSLFPKTTDQTSYFQAGVAVAHGHLRLGGWLLTPPDFWTSDIALSAVLSLVWRMLGRPEGSPFLLMLQPAIMWTGLVASAIAMVRLRGGRWPAVAIIAVLLGTPLFAMPVAYFTTLSAIHLGSVLYAGWALFWAARAFDASSLRKERRAGVACALLLLLGVIGDPLVIVSGTLPVLVLSARSGRWRIGVIAVLATTLARLLLALNTATGGFATAPLPLRFADFQALGPNLAVTLHDMLVLFGADPTGRAVSDTLPELLRVPLLLLALAATINTVRQHFVPSWNTLLVTASALTALALLASDRIGLEAGSIATARYLFPLWFDLAVLAACCFGRSRRAGLWALAALSVSVAGNARVLPRHATGILSAEDNALVARLEAEGLHNGIGSWWASGAFDVASLGRVHVVPAIAGGQCGLSPLVQIRPYFALSDIMRGPFFVLVPAPRETYDEANVRACLGTPARKFLQGRYEVLVYPARPGHLS